MRVRPRTLGTLRRGFWTIGRPWGIPIRLHWSVPLGILVLGGAELVPAFWLGMFVLVLLHEAGHAVLARRYGLAIVSIDVHGFGGACVLAGDPTRREAAIIAWGGVIAQAALFVLAVVWGPILPADLRDAWTRANLLILALNLLPIPPFDGAEAWSVFRDRWR
jgi:stage IV sporulation protein FB